MGRVQPSRPLGSGSSPRSFFTLKRTWTVVFLSFAAIWLSVFRFGMFVQKKRLGSHDNNKNSGGTALASMVHPDIITLDPSCTSLSSTRAVAFRCFLGNSHVDSAAKAFTFRNDMGFCRSDAAQGKAALVHGQLDFRPPAICPPAPPASSLWSMQRPPLKKIACVRSAALAAILEEARSPLCLEIAPQAVPLIEALLRGGGGGPGGARGRGGPSSPAKGEIRPSPPIWSSTVCGFLARELAAARDPSPKLSNEDIGAADYTVRACGITIGPADLIDHCGLEPILVNADRLTNPFSREVPQTFFFWNKAFAAATEASPYHMVDGTYVFNSTPYELGLLNSPPASTFYVIASVLSKFIDLIVPQIATPFVVVSGSSDDGSPLLRADNDAEQRNWGRMNRFLDNPLLIALFVQNPNMKHRKVVPNHIGLDYHTIARPEIESHGWGTPMSVLQQDAELMTLRCSLPPFVLRPPTALMNFKEAGRGIRSMVAALLNNRPGVQYVGDLSRSKLWASYGEFAFVISPRGYGLDCHRTWEALALGNAVIASVDDFLHELYEDLPIIQVSNWDTVNEKNLQKWHSELSKRWGTFKFEKLRESYWTSAVERAREQANLNGIYEFSTNAGNYSAGRLVWGRK